MKSAISRGVETLRIRLRNADPYVIRRAEKRYRKGMKYFWWYGVFISASSAFVDSFITLYVLSLGGTSLQVGALSSLASLFGLLMPIPGAQWAARWGRTKPVVLITFSLRRVALLLALLTPYLLKQPALVPVVIGMFALRAAFFHLGNSSWTVFAGEIMPQQLRGRYFSSRKTVMSVATLLFVPLAGQLIDAFVVPRGYQISFLISIVCGAAALYLFGRIPELKVEEKATQAPRFATFWQAILHNRNLLLFTLIGMFFNFAWQLGGPYFGVYQVTVLGATPRIVGILSMAGSLARVVGQQVWGRVVDRRGAGWALTLCRLLVPFLPFIWLPLTNPWQLLFVVIPSGFLWAGHEIANFNMVLELPHEENQTQAIASYNTLIGLANIAGPLVGGQVVTSLGYKWDFALSGIGRLIAALLLMALLRPFGRTGKIRK